MTKQGKRIPWILFSGIFLFVLALLSICVGRYPTPVSKVISLLASRVCPGVIPNWTGAMEATVFHIRIPRILLACLTGCCLSAAGSVYQGIFRNPLASPDLLGASSGAAFGAALAILLGYGRTLITLFAFAGSLLTLLMVLLLTVRCPGQKTINLILAGVMVSSLCSAGLSFLKLVADPDNQLPAITYWMMGSLAQSSLREIGIAALPMFLGLIPLLWVRWRLNLLTLSEEEARTMGVNTSRLRLLGMVCSTLMTAACVSVSGLIGFVGLVVPHLSRSLVGNDFRRLLPCSMLLGASFLLLTDNLCRTLFSTELPIGILTTAVGVPFFLVLISRKEPVL